MIKKSFFFCKDNILQIILETMEMKKKTIRQYVKECLTGIGTVEFQKSLGRLKCSVK